jgi:hypothetical protein
VVFLTQEVSATLQSANIRNIGFWLRRACSEGQFAAPVATGHCSTLAVCALWNGKHRDAGWPPLLHWVEGFLGDLHPDKLRVELYAGPVHGSGSVLEAMNSCKPFAVSPNPQVHSGQGSATRHPSDYTPRIVPQHRNASVPLEGEQILWQC